MSASPVYLVLLHYPIVNRHGQIVTTSVTNLDIHDIARSSRTYGVRKFFIVTPIREQQVLVGRILGHWSTDQSQAYHPDRVEAVSSVSVVTDFDEVKRQVALDANLGADQSPEVWLPDARPIPGAATYGELREKLAAGKGPPVILVLGTGWGVADAFYPEVHRYLAPIYGPGSYNHLSVRAAAAIILDRILGR